MREDFEELLIYQLKIDDYLGLSNDIRDNEGCEKVRHTLILLGNRIFAAPNGFRHPIRYIHELYMVLTGGIINSSFGKWRCWENEKFVEADFIRFISDEDPLANDFLDAMSPFTMFVNYGNYRIERESYSLNIAKHWELNDKNLFNLSTKEQLDFREEYRKKHDEILRRLQEEKSC